MNTLTQCLLPPSPRAACLAVLAGGAIFALSFAAHASMPQQRTQSTTQYICEVDAEAPTSVRAANEEYYECLSPTIDEWLDQYPDEVAQLRHLYDSWERGRDHDLRGQSFAAGWVREHPVDFSRRDVHLTSAQSLELAPNMQSEPPLISGAFQRLFVDRTNQSLYLTSRQEGLVSIDISQRYAFEFQGNIGSGAGTDFFIYDNNTAFVEEPNEAGGNRDLVVLDISDRSNPREITRLAGVLPTVTASGNFLYEIPDHPPTFDHYRLIRQGRLVTSTCGHPPTVSTHPDMHCRPDGTCYRRQITTTADEGVCQRVTARAVPTRPTRTRSMPSTSSVRSGSSASSAPPPMADFDMGMDSLAGSGGAGVFMEAEESAGPVAAPQGGDGGAGSLSQMMVYGNTLYVLSGAQGVTSGWLTTFDLSNPQSPEVSHLIELDNGPEALQRHDNLLLVAGRDAVVTASLGRANQPRLLGEFRQNCPVNYDPVVVEGSIAYRTIIVENGWSTCTSRLEVIDLSQPHQPVLRTTHPIARPRGLAVLGERLFVADEFTGVRIFDLTDPVAPTLAATWQLSGVVDLVLSDFDLYAMTPNEIRTFFVGPLYEPEAVVSEVAPEIEGFLTVLRVDDDA